MLVAMFQLLVRVRLAGLNGAFLVSGTFAATHANIQQMRRRILASEHQKCRNNADGHADAGQKTGRRPPHIAPAKLSDVA